MPRAAWVYGFWLASATCGLILSPKALGYLENEVGQRIPPWTPVNAWDMMLTSVFKSDIWGNYVGAFLTADTSPAALIRSNGVVDIVVAANRTIWGPVGGPALCTPEINDPRPDVGVESLTSVRQPVPYTLALSQKRTIPERGCPEVYSSHGAWIAYGEGVLADGLVMRDALHTATSGLLIGDALTLPLALAVFAGLTKRARLVALPVLSAAVTGCSAFCTLALVGSMAPLLEFALNLQCALALALSIDYTLFRVKSPRATHTIVVSAVMLVGAISSLLVVPVSFLRSLAWVAIGAVLWAAAVNLTLIPLLCPTPPPIYEEPDDDEPLLEQLPIKRPIALRHPGGVMVLYASIVGAAIWQCSLTRLCGGVMCMAPHSPRLDALLTAAHDPQPITLYSHSGIAKFGACARVDAAFATSGYYTVNTIGPLIMTPDYIDAMDRILACMGPDDAVVSAGLSEYFLFRRTTAVVGKVAAVVFGSVFTVLGTAYRSPVIALKGAAAVGGTFAIATAAVSVLFGGKICWLIMVLALPISVGLGMDFHVFFLDALPSRDIAGVEAAARSARGVINGAGIILALAFAGLYAVKITSVRQASVFMVVSVICDTAFMRPLVIPAAMALLGRYNWYPFN